MSFYVMGSAGSADQLIGLADVLAMAIPTQDDGVAASIGDAGESIVGALAPSPCDWIALVVSAIATIATLAVIYVNFKTVRAAQRQYEVGLYPLRRNVLQTLDSGNHQAIRELAPDIEFLFGREAQESFQEYVRLDREIGGFYTWRRLLEESVMNRDDDDPEKADLEELEHWSGIMPLEQYHEKKERILMGVSARVFNPDTMEAEFVNWEDLTGKINALQGPWDEARIALRFKIMAEIAESLRS